MSTPQIKGCLKYILYLLFLIFFLGFHAIARADITTGLVGYWTFDEGAGNTAADSSSSSNNGALVNGPSWAAGKIGTGALSFNGTNNYVSTSQRTIGTGDITTCAWAYVNPGLKPISTIISNGDYAMAINIADNPAERVTVWSNHGLSQTYSNTHPITVSAWNHVCAVRLSDGTTNFYVNGAAQGSGNSGTPSAVYSYNETIGADYPGSGDLFPGSLDDVRVYNRALSAADISELYAYTGGGGGAQQPPQPPPASDTTPPVVSAVTSSSVTSTGAAISWTTDEPADSQVSYGLTTLYGSQTSLNPSLTTSHSVSLSSLTPNTVYHYKALSKDTAGNPAQSSDQVFTTLSASAPPVSNVLIPEDRRIDWTQTGVPGGIPNRTTICANVKDAPYNAKGDGVTDDTPAITAALAACSSGVLYIPTGTYKLLGRINASKSNITWRGDGMGKTILKTYSGDNIYVGNGDWPTRSPTVTITGGATRGSNTVTVNDTSGITVGKLITITQTNPDWVHYNSNYFGNGPGDSGHDKNRLMALTFLVTGKTANTVSFNHPLPIDMPNAPMITLFDYIITGTGFEDMTFDMTNGGGSAAVLWYQVYGCWVKGVEIEHTSNRFLWFDYAVNCEVRDSYFHDASVTKKEGLDLTQNDTYNLIENNTLVRAGAPMIILGDWAGGSSGNVVAYNYLEDEQGWGDVIPYALSDNHGAHDMFNLFEGNVAQNFSSDGYYGSASHTTLFRNRLTGNYDKSVYISDYALELAHWATSYNIIGNVLGTGGGYSTILKASGSQYQQGVIYSLGYPNCCNYGFSGTASNPADPNYFDTNVEASTIFHGNFDYVNDATIWDPNISTHALPASLYLSSKPSWFGSTAVFPPIGPDVSGLSNKIPAQICYEQGKAPNCLSGSYVPPLPPVTPPPDTTPPTVSVTAPVNGSTASGSVSIVAVASDNVGVAGVQWKLDGSNLGAELTVAPYSGTWNTVGVSNDAHTLTAVARDAAGNTKTSTVVTVNVSNTSVTASQSSPASSAPSAGTLTPTVAQPTAKTAPSIPAAAPLIPANLLSLTYGTRGTDVITLQNLLIKNGYLAPGLNTGFYGSLTQAAIARYRSTLSTSVPTSSPPVSPAFTRTLKVGSTGSDVKNLQLFLNARGFQVSLSGAGSPGNETVYYGPATARAVSKFQEANRAAILTPVGLTQGTGNFGPASLKAVNLLIQSGR